MAKNSSLITVGYILSCLGGLLTIFSLSSVEAETYGLYVSLVAVGVAGLGLWLIYLGNKP